MNHVLEFDGIDISFGTQHVLSGVYMKCTTTQITGLLGRNGSGKSTLMKVVFGSLQATSKSVRVDDERLIENYFHRNLIRYLPQENFLPSFLRVGQVLRLFGLKANDLVFWFPEFGDLLDHRPSQLSGGYRRILEVWLILKSSSLFCLLDEPFSGLMPAHIDVLKKIMVDEKQNKGIVISDHLYRHILEISDELYVLANKTTYRVNDADELMRRGYLPD